MSCGLPKLSESVGNSPNSVDIRHDACPRGFQGFMRVKTIVFTFMFVLSTMTCSPPPDEGVFDRVFLEQ